jgi:hypothetical protein
MSRRSFAARCIALHRQGQGRPMPIPTDDQVLVSYDGTSYLYGEIEPAEIPALTEWAVGAWGAEHPNDAANIEANADFDHLARTLWLD